MAEVLLKLKEVLSPGISTLDLNRIAEEMIRRRGGVPTFVGYQGFPKSLCTSVNEEVVHGIPKREKVLQEGDIVGVDCGVTLEGFVADHALTLPVGMISATRQRLVEAAQQALYAGIAAFTLDGRIGDIGHAIETLASEFGYGVVRDFVGHGVGRKMHEEPQVPNFGTQGSGPRIKEGMVIAIEPMFTMGTHEVKVLPDGWTVVTKDGMDSAHFEHTVAMTENGPEILTKI